jgi:hypothetical protein
MNLEGVYFCEGCGKRFEFLNEKIDHIKEVILNGKGSNPCVCRLPQNPKTRNLVFSNPTGETLASAKTAGVGTSAH